MSVDQNKESVHQLHFSLFIYSIWIILSTIIAVSQKEVFWLALPAFVGFAVWVGWYFVLNKEFNFPHGPANAVTLLRFFGLITVTLMHPALSYFATGILLTLICLGDLLDGYIARTLNMITTIGEYMDKETDALFVLLACFVLFQKGFTGTWILSLGLIRYVYFVMIYFFLKPSQKEHKDPIAKLIAILVFIGILECFFIPYRWSFPVLVVCSVLLLYSFCRGVLVELGLTHRAKS